MVRFEAPSSNLNRSAFTLSASKAPILVLRFDGVWNTERESRFVRWALRELEYTGARILIADFSAVQIRESEPPDLLPIKGEPLAFSNVLVVASSTLIRNLLRYSAFTFFGSFDAACNEALSLSKGRNANPDRQATEMRLLTPVLPIVQPVEVECFALQPSPSVRRLVVFRLVGAYPHGAAGTACGRAIKWNLERFTDTLKPTEVIVDARDLKYEWGDDLFLAPSLFSHKDSRIRFLVTPDQRVGAFAGTGPYVTDWRMALSALQW